MRTFLRHIDPLWLAMALATGVYLWLMSRVPLAIIPDKGYDDALFVKLADHIFQGLWLGSYNQFTLAKGPGYPVWIALNFWLGLPLMLSQSALYALAGWIFVAVLRPQARRPWPLLALFAAYLFNPMVYGVQSLRVTRAGLYVPLTILVLALAMGCAQANSRPGPRRWLWACGLGLTLGLYWTTREASVWLVPSLLVMAAAAFASAWRQVGALLRTAGLATVVAAAAAVPVGTVAWANYAKYGVWNVVEFKQREFLAAYGALSRIRHEHWRRHVVVPQEVLAKAAQASASFAPVMGYFNPGWAQWGCWNDHIAPCDGEYRGGWFMWALREAVSQAGHYATALEARDFYGRLAGEIDAACADGRLSCLAPRATLAPPFRIGYVADTARSFWKALRFVVLLRGLDIRPGYSGEYTSSYDAFSRMIQGPVFPVKDRWTLSGEIFMSRLADPHVEFVCGELVDHWTSVRRRGARIHFMLSTESKDASCELVVRDRRAPDERFALADLKEGATLERGALKLVVKTAREEPAVLPYGSVRAVRVFRVLAALGSVYQLLLPLCAALGLACYAWSWAQALRRKRVDFLLFVGAALLAAVLSRLLLLSYMDATVWPAINILYCSPIYPVLILFCGVAVAGLVP
jgi:hypothetical protein